MFEQNMETEKLMQSNDATLTVTQTEPQKVCVDGEVTVNGECVKQVNGGCENGGNLTKPELIEMSTSTQSVKCCNGLFLKNKLKQKNMANGIGTGEQPVVIPTTTTETKVQSNGSTNGKFNFNTLRAKLTASSNGKYHINGQCNEEPCKEGGGGGDCGEKHIKCPKEKKMKKCKQQQTTTTDVFEDHDPFKINASAVQYEYLNVFAEPNTGTYSFNPTWSFTSKMYFNIKLYLYRLFAILIGIPCAFLCAIIFAIFSVFQIWIFMPLLRMFKTIFGFIREIWLVIIDTVFGPIIQIFLVCRQPPPGTTGYRHVGTDSSQCPPPSMV